MQLSESVVTNTITATNGDAFYGDKVEGNKVYNTIIKQNVSLDSVQPLLLDSLNKTREQTKDALEMLLMLPSLSKEARISIYSLKVVLGLEATEQEKDMVRQSFSNLLKTPNENIGYQDIVNSAAIILLQANKSPEEINEIYKRLPSGEFTKFSYVLHIKQLDSLESLPFELTEASPLVLKAVLDKTLHFGLIEDSNYILDLLKEIDPFGEFQRHEVLIKCIKLNKLVPVDYFCLTNNEKQIFDDTSRELLLYCNREGVDNVFLSIIVQMANYSQCHNKPLIDYLEVHQGQLDRLTDVKTEELQISLSQASSIKYRQDIDLLTDDELVKRIFSCAEKDKFSGTLIIDKFCQRSNNNLIAQILTDLEGLGSTFGRLSNYCVLASFSCKYLSREDFPKVKLYEYLLELFKLQNIQVMLFNLIAEKLIENGHETIALMSLNHVFKDYNPWLSDMYLNYLSLLHQNHQFNELNQRLDSLEPCDSTNPQILHLKSYIASTQEEYAKAETFYQSELLHFHERQLSKKEKEHCIHLWLSRLCNANKCENSNRSMLIHEIPVSIFTDHENEQAWELLAFFDGRLLEIQDLILSWFFHNPNCYADKLFKILMNQSQSEPSFPLNSTFQTAFKYTENNTPKIKIVVTDLTLSTQFPEYLIHIDMGLAQKLNNHSLGEYFIYKSKHCIIKEVLSPVSAAYQIASRIMDNDENQCFTQVMLPSENLTFDILKEAIDSVFEHEEKNEYLKKLMLNNIPINFKYKFIRESNNFAKAVKAILSTKVYFGIYCNTEDDLTNSYEENIVIDEVGFAFLAITGLWEKYSNSNLHITLETSESINSFIYSYSETGIAFSKESDSFINLTDENQADNFNIRDEVLSLYSKCHIYNEHDYDVPLRFILHTKELLTQSQISSLGLASTNNWAYFVPDQQMRTLLRNSDFNCVRLAMNNSVDFFFNDSSIDIIGKILQLAKHNFRFYITYDAIHDFCVNSSLRQLESLICYIDSSKFTVENKEILTRIFKYFILKHLLKKLSVHNFNGYDGILSSILIKILEIEPEMTNKTDLVLSLIPGDYIEDLFKKYNLTGKNSFQSIIDYYLKIVGVSLSYLHINNRHFWELLTTKV